MHIKRIHEMVEKLTECALCELNKGIECVDTKEFGEVVDAISDLCEAEKCALIAKEMKEYKEEEEAEEKYMMRMLKEEHKDEYKHMREEYGEEDGERRFYDNYRYANGRFAPTGRGSYRPGSSGRRGGRRGYEEPMYHMMPDMYREYTPEELRDMDRDSRNVMYYTPMSGGNMSGSGNASGGSNGGGNTRSYTEGFNDGQTRGYSEGYERGKSDGSRSNSSRYDNARRGYEETKEMHKGNSPQENSENMKHLEELLNVVGGDVKELSPKMSPSEKAMTAQKFDTWAKMLKQ